MSAMTTAKPCEDTVHLVRARPRDDDLHTGTALSQDVRSGRMLRLRRGVYVSPEDWLRSPPWRRHLLSVVATAMQEGEATFCRESALALHGVPLLEAPDAVHRRCTSRSAARRVPAPSMMGDRPAAAARRMLAAMTPSGEAVPSESVLAGLPTHRLEPTAPHQMRRPEARRALRDGELSVPRQILDGDAVPWCVADVDGFAVEPLALAVVDTVPRLSPAEGVVILDAVLGGHTRTGVQVDGDELAFWAERIPSKRLRARWERALAAADPRAESPGESYSRVRIAELGFEIPMLQSRIVVGGAEYRVDAEWRDVGVVGEFDGKVKYTRAAELGGGDPVRTVYREKVREDDIRSTGRAMVRWGWTELRRPELLARRLDAAGVPRRRTGRRGNVVGRRIG